MCPKYRSSQDRYWDRPLREHAMVLLYEALHGGHDARPEHRMRDAAAHREHVSGQPWQAEEVVRQRSPERPEQHDAGR